MRNPQVKFNSEVASVTLSDSLLHRLKTVLLHGIEENPDPGDMT